LAKYSFTPQLKEIVLLLWNNGKSTSKSLDDITAGVGGKGAYGMVRRLGYVPWELAEDAGDIHHRRLTKRGEQFAQGKLSIPKKIEGSAPNCTAVAGTAMITIKDV
jgi:hypothetical protein